MTDIDYPPTQTHTLGAALSTVEERIADLDGEIATLEDAEDADAKTLAEKRQEKTSAQNQRDALQWAVHGDGRDDGFDGWGEGAEVTLQAFTATRRGDVIDALNRTTMGPVGPEKTRTWLVTNSVETAPWLDGGEDFQDRAAVADAVPPALIDWLESQVEDLNDLGN